MSHSHPACHEEFELDENTHAQIMQLQQVSPGITHDWAYQYLSIL
jgi:hypothetical protein